MATPLYYPTTTNAVQKTLDAALLTGATASATLNNVTGIQNLKGLMVIDRVDGNNNLTPNKREYISFAGTSGSTVITLVRGLAGSTDQDHAVGAIVEFVSDVVQQQAIIDGLLLTVTTAGVLNKASGAEVTTGTDDAKIVTAKAIADAGLTVTTTSTTTLTNKRIEPRIVTASSYTTDTGTSLSVATADVFEVTAQAGALLFNAPGGTPVNGQKLIITVTDNGTARALTWNAVFIASTDLALPSTTVLSKTLYCGFIYNSTKSKWILLALLNNI